MRQDLLQSQSTFQGHASSAYPSMNVQALCSKAHLRAARGLLALLPAPRASVSASPRRAAAASPRQRQKHCTVPDLYTSGEALYGCRKYRSVHAPAHQVRLPCHILRCTLAQQVSQRSRRPEALQSLRALRACLNTCLHRSCLQPDQLTP